MKYSKFLVRLIMQGIDARKIEFREIKYYMYIYRILIIIN